MSLEMLSEIVHNNNSNNNDDMIETNLYNSMKR